MPVFTGPIGRFERDGVQYSWRLELGFKDVASESAYRRNSFGNFDLQVDELVCQLA